MWLVDGLVESDDALLSSNAEDEKVGLIYLAAFALSSKDKVMLFRGISIDVMICPIAC
jgi:hypothetical protein